MKNRSLFLCGLLILSFAAAVLVDGCSSANPSQVTAPTLKQTKLRVDGPMIRYRNAAAAGAVTPGERERIDAAYNNFQQAYNAALQAANSDDSAATPENVQALANRVIEATSASTF